MTALHKQILAVLPLLYFVSSGSSNVLTAILLMHILVSYFRYNITIISL